MGRLPATFVCKTTCRDEGKHISDALFVSILTICPTITFSPREALAFRFDEIVRQMSRALDTRLFDYDLSRTQWRLLAYVLKHEGITQSELARAADLERASVGQTIDVMERKQMVERRHAEGDRRVWRIFSTQKAQALVPELRVVVDDVFTCMFTGFDAGKDDTLRALLDQLVTNLDQLSSANDRSN
jgi:MarR family transcriptional regulator, transcriptional regulator for hemolysin